MFPVNSHCAPRGSHSKTVAAASAATIHATRILTVLRDAQVFAIGRASPESRSDTMPEFPQGGSLADIRAPSVAPRLASTSASIEPAPMCDR